MSGPHRNHIELRSRDLVPPRQCVADDHGDKNAPRLREINAMTRQLAVAFGLLSSFPPLGRPPAGPRGGR